MAHGSLSHERHLPGADGQEFIATSLALALALLFYFPGTEREENISPRYREEFVILGIRCTEYEKDAPSADVDMFPSAQHLWVLEKRKN